MSLKLLSPTQWSLSIVLLIAVVTLLRCLLQNRRWLPMAVWSLLWWLVLARLLLPLCLPCSYSLQNLWPENNPQTVIAETPNINNFIHLADVNPDPALPDNPTYTANSPTEAAIHLNTGAQLPIWQLIWLTGASICAAFFGLVYWRSKRRFQQTEALKPELQTSVQQWLAEHQLRRTVTVRQTNQICTPLTYGLFRPVILLPADMPSQQQDSLHFALLHEWTHIRHFDAAAKMLAAAALCLHWFNPAVWLFFALFNRDLELACDAGVLKHCGADAKNRRNYALALLSWAETQNTAAAFCSNFGQSPNNVIEKRIVNIMNMKKVSVLSLAAACLLLFGTVIAGATNQPEPNNLPTADQLNNADYIDYNNLSDAELHQIYSEQSRAQWAMLLEPYTQFGLGWQFDDPDFDGNGLKMYYQGHEVSGIYDETTGIWLTEHTGDSNFAADAVELHTVYTDGQLSGLRLATPEEQAQWDEQRARPMHKYVAPYEQFGLTMGEKNLLFYNGQPVRYFWDGYNVTENGQNLGRAIHFEYLNQQGEVDLRTRRDVIYNADGSVDPFGELLGLEVYVEENFAAMLNPAAQQIAYAEYDEEQADQTATDEMPRRQVAYNIYNNPDEGAEHDQTFIELMAQYEQFGLEYREEITDIGTRRNIYFQGELVSAFIDNTRSRGMTVQSSTQPEQPQFVMTEYDTRGQLIGLRLATEEEVNERLNRYSPKNDIKFQRAYNADGELTLYYSTDNNRTHKAIAKPE